MASPMPMIGPMSGEMSIAPMMTAVELTFSPSDAMNMAKISTHRLAPLKLTPLLICSTISCSSSLSGIMLKYTFALLIASVSVMVVGIMMLVWQGLSCKPLLWIEFRFLLI